MFFRATVVAALVLLGVALLVGGVAAYAMARQGLSTRAEPTWAETVIAQAMRRLATPAAVRDRVNPEPANAAAFESGLAHFADHCASCHANDGSGQVEMGQALYPKAPDMRLAATQNLTDGELFAIIENGIRLTGMPAWGTGTPDGERDSWHLVHFIRRLPTLSADDVARMEDLNPKSPEAFREEEEIRRFLEEEGNPPGLASSTGTHHQHPSPPKQP